MRRTVSCSLNSFSSRRGGAAVVFPTTRPAAMTAAMPVSSTRALLMKNRATAQARVKVFCIPSGRETAGGEEASARRRPPAQQGPGAQAQGRAQSP